MNKKELKLKAALKRRKISNKYILPTSWALFLIAYLFSDIKLLGSIALAYGMIYFFLLLSWLFVKCPSCSEFYFGSWQTTKDIHNGCRVCGIEKYESNT